MEEYLTETSTIDYMNSHIQEKAQELKNQSTGTVDYIKRVIFFSGMRFPLRRY